ncbi:MAG TPA: hypothetical protein VD884_13605 [Ohtaekwangia sp.]|nr:hypothetical protein [Ohtaekwangia sp.]
MKTKHSLVVALLLALITSVSMANDGKYIEAMKKSITQLYEADQIAEYQESVNAFNRIASAEKNKWEAYYYSAYANIMMATLEPYAEKKDAYLDQAMLAIEEAKSLAPNESEVIALEGFAMMMRISVDPGSRGAMYAPQAQQSFNKAVALNENNPRALALKAQMEFGTAQFFGSSTKDACATNAMAIEKFGTYTSENILAPQWGTTMTEGLAEKCK